MVTKHLGESANEGTGHLAGLEFRIKGRDSLVRKLKDKSKVKGLSIKEYSDQVTDVLRYTNVSKPSNLAKDYFIIQEELGKKGYTTVEVVNTLDIKDNSYRGINTLVQNKGGYVFELQFHTPQSLEIKNRNHKLYEEQRLKETSVKRKMELELEMTENSRRIHSPRDIEKIEDIKWEN